MLCDQAALFLQLIVHLFAHNALACGFVIADRREMYGGYDRYLLKKML